MAIMAIHYYCRIENNNEKIYKKFCKETGLFAYLLRLKLYITYTHIL